jgi:hypothetical protein
VTLTAVVTRNNDTGNPQPLEGAIVTFEADGGSVNPPQGTTDASGSFSTQVTANAGPNRVVVDIAAWVNGTQVATKAVEAIIDDDVPANFDLLFRTSFVSGVDLLYEDCSGQTDPGHYETGPGPYTFDVQGAVTCPAAVGEGTPATKFYAVTSDQFSDTGLGNGIIEIETGGTLTARFTCTGDPACDSETAEASSHHEVRIEFRIAESVNFEFDGTHTATGPVLQPQFTVTRIDGGRTDEKMNWNGYNQSSWDGTLEPGDYRVLYRADGVVHHAAGDPLPESTASWDTALTLKLTQIPAQAAGRSRQF